MIVPSMNQLSKCKFILFKLRIWYFKEFFYAFLCFSMLLDNNVCYPRVGIFSSRTKYASPNAVNVFIKSQLKLSLPFLIFWFGVTVLFLFIYILLVIVSYQKRFYCYIINKKFFLASLTISMKKLHLNFTGKSQFSFPYIKIFNYDNFSLNEILLIQSMMLN